MDSFKVGDKVTINALEIIGKVTAIKSEAYEVEYYGAAYEIISRDFSEEELTIADINSEIGQQNLQAADSEMA